MYYGRKPCDVEARRHQYEQHVRKLEELKSGHTRFHQSMGREQRDVDNLLRVSHQMHGISLNEEFKRREEREVQTQRRSYNNIRSIIKSELNRKILGVPSRHKPNPFFLNQANLKLIDKIVNVKSQFTFKRQSLEKIVTARLRSDTAEDYSEIYQKSFIHRSKTKRISLKLGKAKLNNKICFRFLNRQSLDHFKKDALFTIELESGDKRKQSKTFQLSEILKSEIHVSFPENEIRLNFLERMGERVMKRFSMGFTEEELNSQERLWSSKVIEDAKSRAIGLVEVQLKKRKEYTFPHSILYDRLVEDIGQKENNPSCLHSQ